MSRGAAAMASISDVQETLAVLQRHCEDFQGLKLICRDGEKLVYARTGGGSEFTGACRGEFTAVVEGHLGDRLDLVPVEDYLGDGGLGLAGLPA